MLSLAVVLIAGCAWISGAGLPLDPSRLREGLPIDRIRVGLHVQVAQAEFELAAGTRVRDSSRELARTQAGGQVVATRQGSDVLLHDTQGRLLARGPWLRLLPGGGEFATKGDRFGGELVLRSASRGLTAVNVIEIEEYLRGVVPWEIGRPNESGLEAVKAQAVAARTYTYAHLGHWEALGFDAYDSVEDQVYRGRSGRHALCDRAIAATSGIVLTQRGKLIRTYYSSTCGGHTSHLRDVWTREPASYLEGSRDAATPQGPSFCAQSPHFRWVESWSARQLGEQIRRYLPQELRQSLTPAQIGNLVDLKVRERDRSGRVRRLAIQTDRAEFELFGDRIRWVLRPLESRFGILRSTMFELEPVRIDGRLVAVTLRGGGFGHGVGMCQSGALGMSAQGYSVEAILGHYYPGTKLASVGSLRELP
jgi:stage II sporulation protein D